MKRRQCSTVHFADEAMTGEFGSSHRVRWLQRLANMRPGRFVSTRTIISINIFVLLVNTYVLIMQLSQTGQLKSEEYFYSPITEAQAANMRSVLKVFANAMDSANISFFLCSGALLGSVRHHGRIPWDDDIDVMVSRDQLGQLESALERLRPEFRLHKFKDWVALGKWKFFREDSEPFLLQPWSQFRWPYVDIFFYESHNSTHLRHSYYQKVWFRRTDVFPLRRRPYDDLMMPTPCNVPNFLLSEFNDPDFNASLCQSRGFSHIMEVPLPHWRQRSLACSRLAGRFPFVHVLNNGSRSAQFEQLRLGEKVVGQFEYTHVKCDGEERRLRR